MLLEKDYKIFYKNKAIKTLLGLEQDGRYLTVETLLCFEVVPEGQISKEEYHLHEPRQFKSLQALLEFLINEL